MGVKHRIMVEFLVEAETVASATMSLNGVESLNKYQTNYLTIPGLVSARVVSAQRIEPKEDSSVDSIR